MGRSTATDRSSFPLLSAAQYHLLLRIIAGLPPGASTFEALFESYNAVLLEDGIDVADENVCYGVLLKLGIERGACWTERWHNLLTTAEERGVHLGHASAHPEPRGGHLDILRQQLEQVTLSTPRQALRPSSVPLESTTTPTTTTTPRRNFLVTTTNLTSSDDDHRAPSPRTRPRHVIDSSSSSSLRPSRVYSDSATHATPPPRSRRLSSTSHSHLPVIPTAPSPPPQLPMVDTLATIRETAATAFRNLSLVGRQFSTWRARTHALYEQQYQVDRSRDNYVLRLSLRRWRRKLSALGELESRLATYEDGKRRSDAERVIVTWAKRFTERKKAEWENALKSAAEQVAGITSARLVSDCLDVRARFALLALYYADYLCTALATQNSRISRNLIPPSQRSISSHPSMDTSLSSRDRPGRVDRSGSRTKRTRNESNRLRRLE